MNNINVDLDVILRICKISSLYLQKENWNLVLKEIVDTAVTISGADFATIQLLDSNSSNLPIVAHHGFPKWWLDYWDKVSVGQGNCVTALENGERIIVERIEENPIFTDTPALNIQLKAGVRAIQSTPILSKSGKPLGMLSTYYKEPYKPSQHEFNLLDLLVNHIAGIIEHENAEVVLKESEGKYRDLFMNLTEEVHFWEIIRDDEHRIKTWRLVDVNPAGLKNWCMNLEDVQGKLVDEIFQGATELFMHIIDRIMTEGEPCSYEVCLPNMDKYFRFISIPLGDNFITMGTEIKNAQNKLQNANKELNTLIEMLPMSICVTYDKDARTMCANPYMEKLLSIYPDSNKSQNVISRAKSDFKSCLKCQMLLPEELPIYEALKTGKAVNDSEFDVLRNDGEIIKLRGNAVPLFDDNGDVRGAVGAFGDVTERKKSEEQQKELLERSKYLQKNFEQQMKN